MSLSIIIVNWNSGQQLVEAVSSIAKCHCGLVVSVIIVDNASNDDSLARVEMLNGLPFKLIILLNSTNRGFGAACNQGAKLATSNYLLFLNPDTLLFENSLIVPLSFMEDQTNQHVGIVGIQLLDQQNLVARSCARFPTFGIFVAQVFGVNRLPGLRHLSTHMTDWAHDQTRTVDHVIGAYYLIRRSLFSSLRGFDERFFVYLEDLDLSLRVRHEGYLSVYLVDAQAFHAGGGTSGQVKAHRLCYSLQSRMLFAFKHFKKYKAWLLLFIMLAVEPWSRLLFAVAKGAWSDLFHTARAYVMLIRDLPKLLLLR